MQFGSFGLALESHTNGKRKIIMPDASVINISVPLQNQRTDEALLLAVGKGDTAALGELYDRYHLAIYRFVSRLAGADAADVDDLLQNTFIEVAKSAGRCRIKASVRNWIFGIAANVVKRHVQRGVRHQKILSALRTVPPPAEFSPFHLTADRETLQILEQALDQLPPKLKIPFVMYEIEGIPGVEIASILCVRKGTLWRRLHEARHILLAELKRVTV